MASANPEGEKPPAKKASSSSGKKGKRRVKQPREQCTIETTEGDTGEEEDVKYRLSHGAPHPIVNLCGAGSLKSIDENSHHRSIQCTSSSSPSTSNAVAGIATVAPAAAPFLDDAAIKDHPPKSDFVVKRKSRTLTFRRKKTEKAKDVTSKKRTNFLTLQLRKRFPIRLRRGKDHGLPDTAASPETPSCVCTGYKRTEDQVGSVAGPSGGVTAPSHRIAVAGNLCSSPLPHPANIHHRLSMGAGPGPSGLPNWLFRMVPAPPQPTPPDTADPSSFDPEEYPVDDIHDLMIAQRERDIERGIEIFVPNSNNTSSVHTSSYPHLRYSGSSSSSSSSSTGCSVTTSSGSLAAIAPGGGATSSTITDQVWRLGTSFQNQCVVTTTYPPIERTVERVESATITYPSESRNQSCYSEYSAATGSTTTTTTAAAGGTGSAFIPRTVHTQIDYIHCLVPDLLQVTNCSFYWGVMDRYEAEALLESKPEGTFLLRDSAQEEFLFSVSFRRYGRSLHARIEQWNHKFSFDSHDPAIFASDTVCNLIEHYKDPNCCLFFEPMLTIPINRSYPFSLQHMCRSVITSHTAYDGINFLPLPKSLKEYLHYYHYKQKVRVRRFEIHN